MLERGGRVRTFHVQATPAVKVFPRVYANVEHGSSLFTDALPTYTMLGEYYRHAIIDHATEYVSGRSHTNTLENFWSLLNRTIKGTYVSVEPFHLFRYLDEQSFRYNERHGTDADRFQTAFSGAFGRRLTYTGLTGKVVAAEA